MANKFATSAESKLYYVAETTPGTTPASPTTTVLPFVKAELSLNQAIYDDNTVYGDRMEHYAIPGMRKVTGTISGDLSHTNFNALFQTLMFGAASSKVFKTGLLLNTITIEQYFSDISQGKVFTGCFVDKIQFKITPSGLATFDATIAGFNMTTETSPLSASPTAAATETPFAACTATMQEGGSVIAYVSSIDVSVDNAATAQDVVGSNVPAFYTPGLSKVTGTLNVWLQDSTLLAKFLNGTPTSIQCQLSDGTNTWTINMPNVIYSGEKMSVSGSAAINLSLPFKALKDPTSGSNVIISYS